MLTPRFLFFLLSVLALAVPSWADQAECKERRQRASKAFSDGVLLLHSRTITYDADDGYREEPTFYYLTGLENSPSVILAIEGKSGDSWLFLNTKLLGDIRLGAESERKLDMQHVVDWSQLDDFLTRQIATGAVIYFQPETPMLPENLSANTERGMPAWVQILQKKWPSAQISTRRLQTPCTDGSGK